MTILYVLVSLALVACASAAAAAVSSVTREPQEDLITALPGLTFPTSYQQFSGYLDAGNESFFHYWFIESQHQPAKDPLLLWLNGGPGCSSMDGLLSELGPFYISDDGINLYNNSQSWNTFANILYLESPACVGFSYNDREDCSASDDSTSMHNHNALKSFFKKFPSYTVNPFFVTGESYAGIYVPTLSVRILENMDTLPLNFQGFAIGNGLSSFEMNDDSLIFFANYHGLLGEILWNQLVHHCCDSDIPSQDTCHFSTSVWPICRTFVRDAMHIVYDSGLNMYNLYADCAPSASSGGGQTSPGLSRYRADSRNLNKFVYVAAAKPANVTQGILTLDPPCTNSAAMSSFLNNPAVRKAIHVSDKVDKWEVCNDQVNAKYLTQYRDMVAQYKALHAAGIKGLVYNGDVDMACNFIGDQWFVEALGYKETAVRRTWKSGGQVGGFVKRFELLDLVTIRGSGHMVPQDKPGPSLDMMRAFVMGTAY